MVTILFLLNDLDRDYADRIRTLLACKYLSDTRCNNMLTTAALLCVNTQIRTS